MRVITLKRDLRLSAIASEYGVSEKELMRINDIEAPSLLPCGMSLVLPSGREREKQKLELFVTNPGPELYGSDSTPVYPVNIFDLDDSRAAHTALPILALSNTDENGFLSAALAHKLFVDENAVQSLIEKLGNKLENEAWGGLLLDMEYLFPFDRDSYTAFVSGLEKAVHRAGCWFMVSVPASAALSPYSRSGAAYDIAALSTLSDRLIIMPEELWTPDRLESFLFGISGLVFPGKLLLSLKPQATIRRGNDETYLPPTAAHNLAISAKVRIRRKGHGYPAEFEFSDAANAVSRVQYTDALWLESFFARIRDFGAAGIFCPGGHSLCPGADFIFDEMFCVEKLI